MPTEPGLDRHEWESELSALEPELETGPRDALPELADLVERMLLERGYDVELRQRERRDAVHANRVAQRDEIEPAAAPVTPGHRSELAAELANALLFGPLDLGWERPLADARHVCLRHS